MTAPKSDDCMGKYTPWTSVYTVSVLLERVMMMMTWSPAWLTYLIAASSVVYATKSISTTTLYSESRAMCISNSLKNWQLPPNAPLYQLSMHTYTSCHDCLPSSCPPELPGWNAACQQRWLHTPAGPCPKDPSQHCGPTFQGGERINTPCKTDLVAQPTASN